MDEGLIRKYKIITKGRKEIVILTRSPCQHTIDSNYNLRRMIRVREGLSITELDLDSDDSRRLEYRSVVILSAKKIEPTRKRKRVPRNLTYKIEDFFKLRAEALLSLKLLHSKSTTDDLSEYLKSTEDLKALLNEPYKYSVPNLASLFKSVMPGITQKYIATIVEGYFLKRKARSDLKTSLRNIDDSSRLFPCNEKIYGTLFYKFMNRKKTMLSVFGVGGYGYYSNHNQRVLILDSESNAVRSSGYVLRIRSDEVFRS